MIDPALISEHPPPRSAPAPRVFDDPAADDRAREERHTTAQQIAFSASPFEWRGKQLAPFAVSREADWMLHRCLIGAPPLSTLIGDQGAMWPDAIRVVWFCSHDPEVWQTKPPVPCIDNDDDRDEPTRRAIAVEREIRAWADRSFTADEMKSIVLLFFRIFNRAHKNHAVVKSDSGGHGAKKNAPSPSPSPATSRSSRASAPASSRSGTSATTSRRSKAGATSTNGRSSKATKPSGPTKGTKTSAGSNPSAGR